MPTVEVKKYTESAHLSHWMSRLMTGSAEVEATLRISCTQIHRVSAVIEAGLEIQHDCTPYTCSADRSLCAVSTVNDGGWQCANASSRWLQVHCIPSRQNWHPGKERRCLPLPVWCH